MPADIWARWLDESEREGEAADRQLRILRSQVRDRVIHKAGLGRGSRVVDLGCGTGFLSLEAARVVGPGGVVFAVDNSPGALRELTRRAARAGLGNLRALEADISSLPLGDGEADAVVARSVLSYVPDRLAVLREALRVLRPGGAISLFEPVLAEENLNLDWGDEVYLWTKLQGMLRQRHPAFSFRRQELVAEVLEAGFEGVDSFTWHADVTRPFAAAEEALEELETALPGELSLAACWLRGGATAQELRSLAARWAEESAKPSYRDILPCVFVWGAKPVPAGDGGG